MSNRLKTALFAFIALASLSIVAIASNTSTYAATAPDPTVIPLEITPVCSSPASGLSYWKVVNKNSTNVEIDWNNTQNNLTGSYQATPGNSQLSTGYVSTDPNNTTQFIWAGNVTQTNATASACDDDVTVPTQPVTPPTAPASCIDGTDQSNLVVSYASSTYTPTSTVSIQTKDNQPLCADVTIYLSSYIMPANYNGNGFYNNPTSTPQQLFSSTSVTLKAGTDGTSTMSITLPDACNNIQVDTYYAPEISTVGVNGHGTQNILSQVFQSNGICQTGGNGGAGSTPTTPVTPVTPPSAPTAPVVSTPATTTPVTPTQTIGNGAAESTPAELPHTGTSLNTTVLTMFALGLATYAGAYILQPRRQS